jgi:tetratricopeptide (TPR) repeat protein
MKQQFTQQQIKFLKENFQQGQTAMQKGMFERAEKYFLAVLKVAPEITEAQNALALSYAARKLHDNATTQFQLVLKSYPKDAHTHHNLANSLYELHKFDDAIKHYNAAVAINPNLIDSHINCAIAYRAIKNYESAIQYLKHSLNLDKTNARAFHILGVIYTTSEDYPRALECLENAHHLIPHNVEFHLSFANVLEKAGLIYEASVEYQTLCNNNPNFSEGFLVYGELLFRTNRFEEAIECYKHALVLTPENLDILDNLGSAYIGLSNIESALKTFEIALKKEPNRISSLTGMEQAYQNDGQLDRAIDLCDKIIALDTNIPTGHVLKSRIVNAKSNDKLVEDLLRFTACDNKEDQTKVHFALGKAYDDRNDYQEAFKHYAIANTLRNKELNYAKEETELEFSKLINFFTPDIFNNKNIGITTDTPILIVGMPRSGTTLTEQILSSHPSVMPAEEVDFWPNASKHLSLRLHTSTQYPECLSQLTQDNANEIATMYMSTLHKIAGINNEAKYITDKMPHNFLNIGLIALLFPNVKFVHTKRDPIDTCLSIYFQNFTNYHSYAFDLNNLGFYYNQYQRIMNYWHQVLPGRIIDINYSDIVSDPEYWTRELISHFDLEWSDSCLAPHKLERTVKTASLWQVRQPIYKTSIQRWKNYEPYIQPLIEALKSDQA